MTVLGGAIALCAAPASARTCPLAVEEPPSLDSREFRVQAFDLSLNIPSNYRSMLRSSGHITFHSPPVYDLIQCLVRTGEYRTIPPYSALEVYRGVNDRADLLEVLRLKRPWLDFYNPNYEEMTFAGKPALYYEYTNPIYGLAIANISFFSRDGRTLLTLAGPADHPIMVDARSLLAPAGSNKNPR